MSDGAPQGQRSDELRSVGGVGRSGVAQDVVHVSQGPGLAPPDRALQGEQQDVLKRLGAVALGPDYLVHQLKPASSLWTGVAAVPLVQGIISDALVFCSASSETRFKSLGPTDLVVNCFSVDHRTLEIRPDKVTKNL